MCFQGLEIIRGCRGLNLVGCDLVEVSPPYDTTGTVLYIYKIIYIIFLSFTFYFHRKHCFDWG